MLCIQPDEAVLIESSADNTRHYLENMFDFYPAGEIVVEFNLHYDKLPTGHCHFSFNETCKCSTKYFFFCNIYTRISIFLYNYTIVNNNIVSFPEAKLLKAYF